MKTLHRYNDGTPIDTQSRNWIDSLTNNTIESIELIESIENYGTLFVCAMKMKTECCVTHSKGVNE